MDLSWNTLLTDTYNILWKLIIRPPRSEYAISELGPTVFRIGMKAYEREDLQLVNSRGMKLECSHFRPRRHTPSKGKLPCVVYLHGNCSSRLEASDTLQVLLPRGMTVFCLDLAGSGRSEGEYISLGHYEQEDLKVVVQHLRDSGTVSSVGVWGRSMGAATTVLRAAEDWSLAACVMDSPFSSLPMVAQELVNSHMVRVPDFLLNSALQMVRKEIKDRARFDIEELLPIRVAPHARSPALFAVAKDDDFVLPHHTYDLRTAWGANESKLVTFTGGHNGSRPQWFLEEAAEFLHTRLQAVCSKQPIGASLSGRGRGALDEEASLPAAPVDNGYGDDDVLYVAPPPEKPSRASASVPPGSLVDRMPQQAAASASTRARSHAVQHKPEGVIVSQLLAMGFSEDVVAEAAHENSTIEAAVDWIMLHSAHMLQESAQALGRLDLRAPVAAGGCGFELEGGTAAAGTPDMPSSAARSGRAEAQHAAYSAAGSGAGARVGAGTAARVAQQLIECGFPPARAMEAAQYNATAEAAIDWLASQGEL